MNILKSGVEGDEVEAEAEAGQREGGFVEFSEGKLNLLTNCCLPFRVREPPSLDASRLASSFSLTNHMGIGAYEIVYFGRFWGMLMKAPFFG